MGLKAPETIEQRRHQAYVAMQIASDARPGRPIVPRQAERVDGSHQAGRHIRGRVRRPLFGEQNKVDGVAASQKLQQGCSSRGPAADCRVWRFGGEEQQLRLSR